MGFNSKLCVAKLAKIGFNLEQKVHPNDFKRIYSAIIGFSDNSEVNVKLKFDCNNNNHVVLTGLIEANIIVQCSRCLGDVNKSLNFDFKVFPIKEHNLEYLAEGCEPVIIDDDGNLDLIDLVEDEIMLKLPERVLHQDIKQCEDNLNVKLNERGIIYGRTEIEKISI